MKYRIEIAEEAADALRRFRKPVVRDEVLAELEKLGEDPFMGERIELGPRGLRGLLVHKFLVHRSPLALRFSVVYDVDERRETILVTSFGVLKADSERYVDLSDL